MRFGSGERVLVTGAAGFIGSHLVDRLLALGCDVVGLDAFTHYYPRGLKEANLRRALAHRGGRFRLVEGDLARLARTDLAPLLRGVDAVAHLAAEPGVRASFGGPSLYHERNVLATERLLEAASRAGVERFVFASSSSVYGGDRGRPVREGDAPRPASPYAATKLEAEGLVEGYARGGRTATALRYFTVYGPRQRPEMALAAFVDRALSGEPVEVYGDGGQVREMTYVSDAVAATVAALGQGPGGGFAVYNVGGGGRASVRELVGLVGEAVGTEVEARYGPEAPGDVRSTWADLSAARRSLGYEPRVGIEAGVRAQVAWALSRGGRRAGALSF